MRERKVSGVGELGGFLNICIKWLFRELFFWIKSKREKCEFYGQVLLLLENKREDEQIKSNEKLRNKFEMMAVAERND